MSPFSLQHTELSLAVGKAKVRAAELQLRLGQLRASQHGAELHDHRTAVAGDLADALDRIEPGMGTQWMQSLYPEVDLRGVPA